MDGRDRNGKFLSGHSIRKPRGAKSELRQRIECFLDERWHLVPQWFDTLKPKAKLEFLAELLPYVVPRLKQLDVDLYKVDEERERVAGLFPPYLFELGKENEN